MRANSGREETSPIENAAPRGPAPVAAVPFWACRATTWFLPVAPPSPPLRRRTALHMFGLTLFEIALIGAAAFAAGAVNSVAGGGLLLLSCAARDRRAASGRQCEQLRFRWPGSLAGAWAFGANFEALLAQPPMLSVIAFVGGIGGGRCCWPPRTQRSRS